MTSALYAYKLTRKFIVGPHPEMDPDIVAILDDDEGQMDVEELEDDFVAMANAPQSGEEDVDEEDDVGEAEESMGSNFNDDEGEEEWPKEETRSRFTEYSMSSSVIPRSEGLQHLDARFEKVWCMTTCCLFIEAQGHCDLVSDLRTVRR